MYIQLKTVTVRMDQHRMMRRGRRGRRINHKLAYQERAYREKRFDNLRLSNLIPSCRLM
ncbi:MAG: RRXRR domain-containing protein [Coleofasciculus sp.]